MAAIYGQKSFLKEKSSEGEGTDVFFELTALYGKGREIPKYGSFEGDQF